MRSARWPAIVRLDEGALLGRLRRGVGFVGFGLFARLDHLAGQLTLTPSSSPRITAVSWSMVCVIGAMMPYCIRILIRSMGLRCINAARSRTVIALSTMTSLGGRNDRARLFARRQRAFLDGVPALPGAAAV
jgi:hypothetical protein